MTQRIHHYERAFEDYLRLRRIPYVAVDEAKKSVLPAAQESLKSFDFVIYGDGLNLLVEIKGRRIASREPTRSSFQNWVTAEDVQSLRTWERLFGAGFEAAFVFVYWCEHQPPDALFQEVFENRGQWYALRTVRVGEYARAMRPRSPRWGTVHVPTGLFESISRPFAPPFPGMQGPQSPALVPHVAVA